MIDCSLLAFQDDYYVLPTLAIAEAIILSGDLNMNRDSPFIGFYDWQNMKLPMMTFDLLPLNHRKILHPKVAIMHSLPQEGGILSNFAMLFDGRARRIKLSDENIAWTNESKMHAMIMFKKEHINVVVVDLQTLSLQAHQLATMSMAQITK